MNKVSVVPAALAFAVLGGMIAAPAASATPHVNEGVCAVYDDNSIKVEDVFKGAGLTSYTYIAPPEMRIVGTCVKAGSIKQGLGPHYDYEIGENVTTITVTYPSYKPIELSHAVFYLEPISVALPPKEEEPPVKEEPVKPPLVNWIVTMPELPTVCKGVPSIPPSTVQVSYATYGEYIAIYPQQGWTFVQDLTEPESDAIGAPHKNYIELHLSELKEVCPPESPDVEKPVEKDPPAVVIPPSEQTPPADGHTPVVTDPIVTNPVTKDQPVVGTPVTPAVPVSDVSLAPAMLANVGDKSVDTAQPQAAASSTKRLADTGFDSVLIALIVAFLAAGYAIRRMSGVIGTVKE